MTIEHLIIQTAKALIEWINSARVGLIIAYSLGIYTVTSLILMLVCGSTEIIDVETFKMLTGIGAVAMISLWIVCLLWFAFSAFITMSSDDPYLSDSVPEINWGMVQDITEYCIVWCEDTQPMCPEKCPLYKYQRYMMWGEEE